jgi:RNA polymerase sigma-70 factor (ECF subfamily)
VDEELIRKAIKRDISAVETLYDQYAPELLSTCFRYTGNREDAEDILHDGFLKIISSLGNFSLRQNGSIQGWMKRIVINTALNHLRDSKKLQTLAEAELMEKIADEPSAEPELQEDLITELDQDQILALICELPQGYRTVFNLYVFENYGHREIAEALSCSINTSKSQLSKARVLLRKKINALVNSKTLLTYAQ